MEDNTTVESKTDITAEMDRLILKQSEEAGEVKDLPFDPLWKLVVERLISEFMDFHFPHMAKAYDVSKVEFLNKELELISDVQGQQRRQRFVDKLIKIPEFSSSKKFGLIHFEAQENADKNFKLRILEYIALAYVNHKAPITSLAVISKATSDYNNNFVHSYYGTDVRFTYIDYKIMEQDEKALMASENPFALVILGSKIRLIAETLSIPEIMEKFFWIYRKLILCKMDEVKHEALYFFLKKCVLVSLPDEENSFHYKKYEYYDDRQSVYCKRQG